MPQLTLDQALQIATRQVQAGKLAEAESLCRQLLGQIPNQPDALHLLGVILFQRGAVDPAIDLLRQAVDREPSRAAFHNNLGNALRASGRLNDAIASYEQALRLKPDFAEGHNNLGIAQGEVGDIDKSIASFRAAIRHKPDYAEAHSNLGNALTLQGDPVAGAAASREALLLNPALAETYNNLANALREQGKIEEAIAACRKAIELKPRLYGPFNNLGGAFFELGKLQESVDAFRQALQLRPDAPEILCNLANSLREMGQIEAAIDAYRRAIALAPNPMYHSNLLFALQFDPHCTLQRLIAEHAEWPRRYAPSIISARPAEPIDRSPDRRLRIGYVSRDLRAHPVGRFMVPLLANHNHAHFEIVCYSSVQVPDNFTAGLQRYADVWRDIRTLSDTAAAEQLAADRVDILIDLTMHGGNNRLMIFAHKPAPVQACYLAYPGTTGLPAMDYRISDPWLDPPDEPNPDFVEKTIRLPRTYWCYQPPISTIEVTPLPAESAGFITFGCLNNFSKVNQSVLAAWREILQRVSNSRLTLHSAAGEHRNTVLEFFAAGSVDPSRIAFIERIPVPRYMAAYHDIDIALDPFPVTGGTTSCDALWMGVPIVTLRGQTAMGRGGVSILSNLDLTDWIAADTRHYIDLAVRRAADITALSQLRKRLRDIMRNSPLMNAPQFAADFEATLRAMWRQSILLQR